MSRPIIEVSGLSKVYRLGEIGAFSLREELAGMWARLRHRPVATPPQEFWALRDVSFTIQPGEVVGVIGRNGAGKSTLLKVLSRITEPTSGRAVLRGRVASLLEVGTGFHPDLSGRDNIFLNGAILGMKRAEIRRKFDEIVAFAEIDQFIDTPVKRYSSGMYVRLAFAVAAHLEPEILIVDEVLAVGDAQFQKKCLGKMRDVSHQSGRTILFVSHNLSAMRTLCDRGILLRQGTVVAIDRIEPIIERFTSDAVSKDNVRHWPVLASAPGNENVRLISISATHPAGGAIPAIDTGVLINVCFFNARLNINLDCTVYVTTSDGTLIFETGCIVSSADDAQVGYYCVSGTIPPHLLNAGRYYIKVLFGQDQAHVLFEQDEVVAFEIENSTIGRGRNLRLSPGVVRPLIAWRHAFSAQPPVPHTSTGASNSHS